MRCCLATATRLISWVRSSGSSERRGDLRADHRRRRVALAYSGSTKSRANESPEPKAESLGTRASVERDEVRAGAAPDVRSATYCRPSLPIVRSCGLALLRAPRLAAHNSSPVSASKAYSDVAAAGDEQRGRSPSRSATSMDPPRSEPRRQGHARECRVCADRPDCRPSKHAASGAVPVFRSIAVSVPYGGLRIGRPLSRRRRRRLRIYGVVPFDPIGIRLRRVVVPAIFAVRHVGVVRLDADRLIRRR